MLNNEEFKLQKGDVVQLDPHKVGNKQFAACLMVCDEIKSWGVQGYVMVPGTGRAYYRAKWEEMDFVGKAVWDVQDE